MPCFSPDSELAQINNGRPVIVEFYASWCPLCKPMLPIFETLSIDVPGVDFYKVDVDAQPAVSAKYEVKAVRRSNIVGKRVSDVVLPHSFRDISCSTTRRTSQRRLARTLTRYWSVPPPLPCEEQCAYIPADFDQGG